MLSSRTLRLLIVYRLYQVVTVNNFTLEVLLLPS